MKGLNKYDRPNWRFIYFDGDAYVIPVDKIKLLGTHNHYNIAIAYGLTSIMIGEDAFTKALCTALCGKGKTTFSHLF